MTTTATTNSCSEDISKSTDHRYSTKQYHLDSVLQKLQKREQRRYKVKDYTLGALSNQKSRTNDQDLFGNPSAADQNHDVTDRVEVQQMINELFGRTDGDSESSSPVAHPMAVTNNLTLNEENLAAETMGRKNKHGMESPTKVKTILTPGTTNVTHGLFSVTKSSDMLSTVGSSTGKDTKDLKIKSSGSESTNEKNRFQKSNYANLALAESKLGYQSSCISNNRQSRSRLRSRN